MVLVSTWFGFYAGMTKVKQTIYDFELLSIISLILGSLLSSCGAAALNEFFESDLDKLMDRTKNRPIPSGDISPKTGLIFGIVTSILGVLTLWIFVNRGAAILSISTLILYLFIYTPLKQKTPLFILEAHMP